MDSNFCSTVRNKLNTDFHEVQYGMQYYGAPYLIRFSTGRAICGVSVLQNMQYVVQYLLATVFKKCAVHSEVLMVSVFQKRYVRSAVLLTSVFKNVQYEVQLQD